MAKYFTSGTTPLGFYDYPPIDIPFIEIDDGEWRKLIDGMLSGKAISTNENGFPVLTDMPVPVSEPEQPVKPVA